MGWTRLRQVALVAADLERAVAELQRSMGLEVAYRDPSVAAFGLRNALLPLGSQFIEVVSPVRQGTAAGRQRDRLGGDGGYMVICHTDDQPARRRRVDQLGVRVAFEAEESGYQIMQLHPADTGGSFLEIDYQPGGDDPWGPWTPAGPDWLASSRRMGEIGAVRVQTADPARTSGRWSDILEIEPDPDGTTLSLSNAKVAFVPGPVEALTGVLVTGPVLDRAVTIAGVEFRPA